MTVIHYQVAIPTGVFRVKLAVEIKPYAVTTSILDCERVLHNGLRMLFGTLR